jgi:glutathione synthase/RimK-type ligase-like ATP-grasp enzyme
MATNLIIVEHAEDWLPEYEGNTVVTAREYINEKKYFTKKPIRIINLCRDYKYLSIGYYCSLLAEARGHKVIPSVNTILELDNRLLYRHSLPELELSAQPAFENPLPTDHIEVQIFFGRTEYPQFKKMATSLFEKLRCPLMRVIFHDQKQGWKIQSIRSQSLHLLRGTARAFFVSALDQYTRQRWSVPKAQSVARYDLAILHNPSEELPPSDMRVLEKFIRIGKTMDMHVELIQKKDLDRLYEFDALFIRETTGIDHHTFRFAKNAEREGMVVIDDPDSIFKCTNKVYLAELLKTHKIKTPATVICDYNGLSEVENTISYPIVLKIPDGSFSRGVFKAENTEELQKIGAELLEESDIILAQEYIYTEFDWRIGILNHQPIFACKYFMTKKHWQIVKHSSDGKHVDGDHAVLSIDQVPPSVLETALQAANLIGDGLYGVDLKQRGDDVFVIEVNDNPSIDMGVEDSYLKDDLYKIILGEFARRLDKQWALGAT